MELSLGIAVEYVVRDFRPLGLKKSGKSTGFVDSSERMLLTISKKNE